jgi:Tetratricopeptide repeat/Peptidase C39 family
MHAGRVVCGRSRWRSFGQPTLPATPAALFIIALLLSSCIAITPRSATTSPSSTVVPDMPIERWGIESCGAGSLSAVLRHYGDPATMAALDASLPKTRGGVLTIDMLIAARQKGFEARLVTGDAAIVTSELRQGRPVILMLQVVDAPGHAYDFFHYVVADGLAPERGLVRTQFGDGRPRWVTFERIEKPWAGGGHAAILIRPRDVSDSLRAAVALEEQRKDSEAAKAYRDILAHHPDSAVAWTNLGNVDMRLGKRGEAEEDFRQALVADASSRDAMNNLAWLLFLEKRLDEAESLARKATAQPGPDSYLMLDTLARVLAAKGACGEAEATFRAAIDAVPPTRAAAKADLEQGLAETQSGCTRS